jgi:hypothetical protein
LETAYLVARLIAKPNREWVNALCRGSLSRPSVLPEETLSCVRLLTKLCD